MYYIITKIKAFQLYFQTLITKKVQKEKEGIVGVKNEETIVTLNG